MDRNFFLSAAPISLYSNGQFCPPGHIWPGPQTNLVVTTWREALLTSSE